MDQTLWSKAHGAATHFPIALVACSAALDTVGWFRAGRPFAGDLHAVGYWTILFGAAGSVPAVISGVLMTKGSVLGHGLLRLHHLFVWPAFGLLIAIATWRALVGRHPARRLLAGYLCGVAAMLTLLIIAAYWGGELLLATAIEPGP
ncbi:hypothetical protein DB347_11150 [Opitutaceae bacterium EW11]|nr:hypothetical protein DB347_11150 [Opitutaceae bacterium EW11]